jgi:hypothetical protein
MVGWVGRLVGIQIAAIIGTIGIVLTVDWLLPFGPVINAVLGMLVSGGVFFWAASVWVDWDTVSTSLEIGSNSVRPGD